MKIKLITLVFALVSSTISFADKPSWAGNGGKPSKYEKQQHKEEMKSKHMYKKNKHEKHDHERTRDRDTHYDREYSRDRDSNYIKTDINRNVSNEEFIQQRVNDTQKNWIDKAFDFLN